MKFRKYNSIDNIDRVSTMQKLLDAGLDKKTWVVQEKIHGANASIWITPDEVRIASRSNFLDSSADFFGSNRVLEDLKAPIQFLQQQQFPGKEIVIYGELAGGQYPHPDVPRVPHAKRCQKGVAYNPDNFFIAYDLVIDGQYQNLFTAMALLKACCFYTLPILAFGTLDEVLQYSNEFQTTVPSMFNLPEIEGNVCEGVVLKPENAFFFPNGDRAILKNKNEKFKEKEKKIRKPKVEEKMSDELQELLTEGVQYITENRLRNVLSKETETWTDKKFGRLLGLFVQDALTDWTKDREDIITSLETKDRKMLTKALNQHTSQFIRKHFVNIVDGTF